MGGFEFTVLQRNLKEWHVLQERPLLSNKSRFDSYSVRNSVGEQGWRSGESTRPPPIWPGFQSRRRRHIWVEFVVGSLPCSERFFSGYSGFPLSSKTNISKFQFDQESGRRRTTMWMCYLQIVIYLFIYFVLIMSYITFRHCRLLNFFSGNLSRNSCILQPLHSYHPYPF